MIFLNMNLFIYLKFQKTCYIYFFPLFSSELKNLKTFKKSFKSKFSSLSTKLWAYHLQPHYTKFQMVIFCHLLQGVKNIYTLYISFWNCNSFVTITEKLLKLKRAKTLHRYAQNHMK